MFETASQRAFTELIHQCLRPAKPRYLRPAKRRQRRPLPIVMLSGPGGSGKSELLNRVHESFYRGRPSVRCRGDAFGDRPHEVALQLGIHLGRRVKRFGRLKFPRLLLGMTAIRGPIGTPEETREEMIRSTFRSRKRLKQWVQQTAEDLLRTVEADAPTRIFTGLILKGILATLETAPLLRGRGLKWYRNGLGQDFADPVDALVDLAAQEAANERTSVDEVLCRAFLADLRDACSTRFFQLYNRDMHYLVVLDDADSPGVRAFFDILAAQREQAWDPLLIVASSSRRYSIAGGPGPEVLPVRRADQVRYTDWLENRHSKAGWSELYPVTLGGVTESEAATCFAPRVADNTLRLRRSGIDVTGIPGGAEHAVVFAHQLTEGHLGGLQLVLRAMTRECARVGAEHLDLRRVLEWPGEDDVPLAEVVLQLVLGTWRDPLRRMLLRSSAARDLGDIALSRVLQSELAPVRQLMLDFRSHDTWVDHPPPIGGSGQPALHPFARRCALHLLANPRTPDEPSWRGVHKHLYQLAENNTTTAMYHSLALGRVGEVAEMLTESFRRQHTQTWFDTLLTVTKAPLENPARQENAESHCDWLASQADAGRPVTAKLVAALQLHSDPLGDPNRDLCLVVAHELETLADHAPDSGPVYLLKQAKNFRTCNHSTSRGYPPTAMWSQIAGRVVEP